MRFLGFLCGLAVLTVSVRADDLPAEARAALGRATDAFRSIATRGGYLWRYAPDLSRRWGEGEATATQVWVQPPGTPEVGMAFLRAYRATKGPKDLDAAREAASALAFGQLESGGWDYKIDFDLNARVKWYRRADMGRLDARAAARRRNRTVLDDDNTQSAIRFLLALGEATTGSADPRDKAARETLDYALAGLLRAQYPNGAFPQVYMGETRNPADHPLKRAVLPADPAALPRVKEYWFFYTFNDHCMRRCVLTLVEAHRKTGRAEYLEAAKKCGEFMLHAQLPEPQPAWAQQYDPQMRPAWARKFEPAGVCSSESAGVVRTLVDLHLVTGDEKYLAAIPAALKWFERSKIAPGRWARFYELNTNRPLYLTRAYELVYSDQDLPTHYSFQGDYGVESAIGYYDEVKRLGRDAYLKKHAASARRNAESLAPRARQVIIDLNEKGFWLKDGQIDSGTFVRNVEVLCEYLDAVR